MKIAWIISWIGAAIAGFWICHIIWRVLYMSYITWMKDDWISLAGVTGVIIWFGALQYIMIFGKEETKTEKKSTENKQNKQTK